MKEIECSITQTVINLKKIGNLKSHLIKMMMLLDVILAELLSSKNFSFQ